MPLRCLLLGLTRWKTSYPHIEHWCIFTLMSSRLLMSSGWNPVLYGIYFIAVLTDTLFFSKQGCVLTCRIPERLTVLKYKTLGWENVKQEILFLLTTLFLVSFFTFRLSWYFVYIWFYDQVLPIIIPFSSFRK